MKISKLPSRLRKLAEQRREEGNTSDTIDDLMHAFVWANAPEGSDFWRDANAGIYLLEYLTEDREEAEKWARAKLNEWYGISDGAKLTSAGVADYNQTIDAMLAMYDKFVLNKD